MSSSKVSRRLTESIAPEVVEHVYRPRLAAELHAAFPYLSWLNMAHLAMLAERGILSPAHAAANAGALLTIADQGPDGITPDPLLEDAYFNIEARLIALAGADAGGRLHIGRSRNDLSAALDRMRARDAALDLLDGVNALRAVLLDRAERFLHVVMPGQTHLQPAQPITFGFYLAGLASALARDAARVLDGWQRLNLSPMGAAALATTTFPIDRARTAALLGFDAVLDHALDCVASRDFALELIAAAAQLALTLSRFARDMHTAVSAEFAAIGFPDSVCGTSSIMPQKKNPVVLEHLMGKAAHVVAAFTSAAGCVRGSYFTNTLDAHREGLAMIWPGLAEAMRALALARLAAAHAEPEAALLLHRARTNFSTATDLADALVREAGMDFRGAHHVAGAVVRALLDRGLAADAATPAMVDDAARTVLGRPAGLSAASLAAALDPTAAVAGRTLPGGTAPHEVRRMVVAMRATLDADTLRAQQLRAGLRHAAEACRHAVQALSAAR
jgi:argininosuccinate lyase